MVIANTTEGVHGISLVDAQTPSLEEREEEHIKEEEKGKEEKDEDEDESYKEEEEDEGNDKLLDYKSSHGEEDSSVGRTESEDPRQLWLEVHVVEYNDTGSDKVILISR